MILRVDLGEVALQAPVGAYSGSPVPACPAGQARRHGRLAPAGSRPPAAGCRQFQLGCSLSRRVGRIMDRQRATSEGRSRIIL